MLLSILKTNAVALGVQVTARLTPVSILRFAYKRATAGLSVAVCLHRVSPKRRPRDPYPQTTATPDDIDTFLRIAASKSETEKPRLSMCFDDGYSDSAEYIASRAPLYPAVEWGFFVCPEKIVKRAGFRWDLYEMVGGEGRTHLRAALRRELNVGKENDRPELHDVGSRPEFALATLERCRELAAMPNVVLGNHTNTHFIPNTLPIEQALVDLRASTHEFETHFGTMRQFAFPFGVPGLHFSREHVDALRKLRGALLWSTEERPYNPAERRPGSVLPRMVFRGLWGGKAMALWTTYCALRFKLGRKPADSFAGADETPVRPEVTTSPAA
jgi:hypothetical protein